MTELLSTRLEAIVGGMIAPGVAVSAPAAETIYALERAAAVAWELEDRRRMQHVEPESVNAELAEQCAAFTAVLVELHRTFSSADTEVSTRIAARIGNVLTRYGITL